MATPDDREERLLFELWETRKRHAESWAVAAGIIAFVCLAVLLARAEIAVELVALIAIGGALVAGAGVHWLLRPGPPPWSDPEYLRRRYRDAFGDDRQRPSD